MILGLLLLAGCTGSDPIDSASEQLTVEVTLDPDQPLLAWANVTLETPGTARVVSWSDEVAARTGPTRDSGTSHRLVVLGLRADSTYEVQVVAVLEDGTVLTSEPQAVETGSLPRDLADFFAAGVSEDAAGITLLGPADPDGEPADSDAPFLFGVDAEGEVVWLYDTTTVGNHANRSAELLASGALQMLTPQSVRAIEPDGETGWLIATDAAGAVHHDAATLPDGHVVLLAETVQAVDVPALGGLVEVTGDRLVELDTDGVEVWSWSTFDHLDTQRYPGELSQKMNDDGTTDWTHANSVVYVESQDALLVSLRHQNQVILIDHETGELLWTLGEDGDFALGEGTWFASQHAASMPEDDLVLLYDNGNERPRPRSRAVAWRLDLDTGTADEDWSWETETYTSNMGDADRLASGNTLVCAAASRRPEDDGRIAEVTPDGEVVWELILTEDDWVYRAERVDWLTPVE